jgi:hypothetical protein
LSADGGTLLISDPERGAAYLYEQADGTWPTTPTATFTGAGSLAALSADGHAVLVSAPQPGALNVYDEADGTWPTVPTVTLQGPSTPGPVALSADGSTVLVGAPKAGPAYSGAAYVYSKTGGTWSPSPVATFAAGQADDDLNGFGSSVALSADGQTALVSASDGGYGNGGAAYVYGDAGGSWSPAPVASFTGAFGFGSSLALSADGQTAVVGVPYEDNGAGPREDGSADVYSEVGGAWPSAPSAALGDVGDAQLGSSVSLSGDGLVALVNGSGAAYVYTGAGGTWSSAPVEAFGGTGMIAADGQSALVNDEDADGINGNTVYLYTSTGNAPAAAGTTVPVQVSGQQEYGTASPGFTYTASPAGLDLVGALSCSTVDGGSPIVPALDAGDFTVDGSSCGGLWLSGVVGPAAAISYTGAPDGFVVYPASQSVLFASVPPTFGSSGETAVGQSYVPRAWATTGLPVVISLNPSSTGGACTLTSGVVHFTGAGRCILDADQAGDADYARGLGQQYADVHTVAQLRTYLLAPRRVALGSHFAYKLRVVDSGPGRATDFIVSLVLPESVVFVSALSKPMLESSTLVQWQPASLGPGHSVSYIVRVKLRDPATGRLVATASVNPGQWGPICLKPDQTSARSITVVDRTLSLGR